MYRILIIISMFLLGYICGSIPNAVIVGKIYHKDPREYGSKNPGGSNVGRVISHTAAAIVITLDILKVAIPFYIFSYLFQYNENFLNLMNDSNELVYFWYGSSNYLSELAIYLIPLGGFIGHSYSCFIKFKGGKIVSTFVALMICSSYMSLPIFLIFFLVVLVNSKHVSLSSIIMSLAYAIYSWILYLIYLLTSYDVSLINKLMWFGYGSPISIFFPIVSTLGFIILLYRHRTNIEKLKEGKESKITWIDNLFNNKK